MVNKLNTTYYLLSRFKIFTLLWAFFHWKYLSNLFSFFFEIWFLWLYIMYFILSSHAPLLKMQSLKYYNNSNNILLWLHIK